MWQQCPNCKGSGTVLYPLSHSTSAVCTVCRGHKIISELTGLPPISEPVKWGDNSSSSHSSSSYDKNIKTMNFLQRLFSKKQVFKL